ncbi:DUF2125 domain-containing protein [Nisaea acidiphila]|uniref:DUF2125 domain-containing protein n=1 Tax=Nisaea acidiphila TaxID=1862145 RepID=A0A9J7ANJ1_9PROT|nr:DUF2125 domain-containing protein [Nisaea acidiphila]UUX48161.1 DUF2125 domain-containing protein [Nisaea acidiphila]
MSSDLIPTPPPHKRQRRIGTVLSFVVALAVLTYVGNWFAAAYWLEGKIQDWAAEEKARGNEIAYRDLRFEGFPFEMSILARDVSYKRTRGRLEEAVSLGALRAVAKPWAPLDYTLTAESDVTATQRNLDQDTLVTMVAAPRSQLDTRFYGSGILEHARLTAFGGQITSERAGDGKGPRDAARFTAASLTIDQAEEIGDHTDASAVLNLTATRVESPILSTLGTRAEHAALALEATLRGALNGTGSDDLALWRDSGGTLDINRFTLAMDPVGLRLNATLALDPLLRPEGAGTLEVKGFDEAIQDLVKAGHMKQDAAEIAKLVLAAFSRTSPSDGTRIVSLPVAAQDGRVSAGPFTLFRIPAF